jgi:transposase
VGVLTRAGKRVVKALRSPATAKCLRCAALERDLETLRNQNVQLRASLVEAQRAAKRQAAPFSKGAPKPNPKPPGRKRGPNYGKKSRRPIPDRFDESYEASIGRCPRCGSTNVDETSVVDQYEEDIPVVRPRVRRFRVHIGQCRDCDARVQGRHRLQTSDAIGAAGVHLGPRARTLAADLSKHVGTSLGKVRAILRTTFSLSVSRGGLSQTLDRVGNTLAPTYDAFIEQVQHSSVVAADETGWRVGGQLRWLWAFVTPQVTVYRIMDGRGFEEACQVLPPDFSGNLLRDGWAPYRRFEQATHQSCIGGHLIRRCKQILQTAKQGAARLPHAVLRILHRSLRLRDHWLDCPPSPHGRAVHIGILAAEMDRFLAWNPTDDENRKLVKHLRNERDALFTFLLDPAVPASNWWGEQAIRPAVVTRKIWGGNRTDNGAVTQQRIASFFRTSDQQGVDPYPLLEAALRAPAPMVLPLPSLIAGP